MNTVANVGSELSTAQARIEVLEADVLRMARAKEAAELRSEADRERADEAWTRVGELELQLAHARGEA